MHYTVAVFTDDTPGDAGVDLDEILAPWGDGREWDYFTRLHNTDLVALDPSCNVPAPALDSTCRLTPKVAEYVARDSCHAFVVDGMWIARKVNNPLFDSAQLAQVPCDYGPNVDPNIVYYSLDNPYFQQALQFTLIRFADKYVTFVDCHN